METNPILFKTFKEEGKRSDKACCSYISEQSEEKPALSREQNEANEHGTPNLIKQLDLIVEKKEIHLNISSVRKENGLAKVSEDLPLNTNNVKDTRWEKLKSIESPQEREERLARTRQYNTYRRQKESPEEREIRLARLRQYKNERIQKETPEEREIRKTKHRERILRKMQSETPEETEKRRARNRARYNARYRRVREQEMQNETPEDREKRLAEYQKSYDRKKQNKETAEQRKKRLAKRRERLAKKSQIHTNEQLDGKNEQISHLVSGLNKPFLEAVEDIIQEPSKLPIILIEDDKKTIKVKIKSSDV